MTACLTLDSVSAATPDGDRLFSNLSLSVGRERIGLVGRNGAGKSTLLAIIAGTREPAGGSVTRCARSGALIQVWPEHLTVAEALGIAPALAAMDRTMSGTGGDADFAAADWTIETRALQALADAGLPGVPFGRLTGSLSGGERTRAGIARLLLEAPDLLLLDEPTNTLDAAGRAAIMDLIRRWPGGAIIASHDRTLLEAMDRIVELAPTRVRIVGGGWSAFTAVRDAERAAAAHDLKRSHAGLRSVQQAAQRQREAKDRRDRAGRAFAARKSEPKILLGRQAERAENSGGQLHRLSERRVGEAEARLAAARGRVEVLTPLTIALPPTGLPAAAVVLDMDGVTATVGTRTLGPWTLRVRGPERVAVAGPNGAGKSTLLRVAAGMLAPGGGTVVRPGGRVALLDQHGALLDPGASVLENVRRLNPALDERGAYAACARFAFRNRDAVQPVGRLSGGERLRAGLAATLAGDRPPWLLMLDEPTNHLDVPSIKVLEEAVAGFDGALLVVSHDPAFLIAIGVERTITLPV